MVKDEKIPSGTIEKMKTLSPEKLLLVINLIDQLSDTTPDTNTRIGIAKGKYKLPASFDAYDDEIIASFGDKL